MEVTVYYTEEAGRNVTRFFKKTFLGYIPLAVSNKNNIERICRLQAVKDCGDRGPQVLCYFSLTAVTVANQQRTTKLTCATVEKLLRLQQNHCDYILTGQLRC